MADDAAAPGGQRSEADGAEPAKPDDEVDASTTGTADEPGEAAEVSDDGGDAEASDDADAEASDDADAEPLVAKAPMSPVRLALIAGLVAVLALSGLIGWLGFRAYQEREAQEQRNLFVQVGRQGALNLTTIDFERVDEDVQRVLDSATGGFYDEFQQRAQPFAEVVKQVKSKSTGKVTEAGLEVTDGNSESESPNEAEVLVAVTVNTSMAGQPEQAPRSWRMRILVQKVGDDDAKVANVEFVP